MGHRHRPADRTRTFGLEAVRVASLVVERRHCSGRHQQAREGRQPVQEAYEVLVVGIVSGKRPCSLPARGIRPPARLQGIVYYPRPPDAAGSSRPWIWTIPQQRVACSPARAGLR